MPELTERSRELLTFIAFLVLALGSSAFLERSRNAALKRRVWRVGGAVFGIGFVVYLCVDGVPVPQLLIAAPMVALITFVNRRMVQFCDACAAMVVGSSPLSKPEFCSKCGAKLAD